jgi:hypothetical protein
MVTGKRQGSSDALLILPLLVEVILHHFFFTLSFETKKFNKIKKNQHESGHSILVIRGKDITMPTRVRCSLEVFLALKNS